MKTPQGYEDAYYGTSEEDALNYGEIHAKPYDMPFYVTKDGTSTRPWVLMVKITTRELHIDSDEGWERLI